MIPATPQEIKALGWSRPDVILVTGDAFIDSPYIGVAVIARTLLAAGFKVGVIAQPDIQSGADITRLGEPGLFWGVTGGCIDSMVANYTATKKRRKRDDYTPGGINDRRPDRASIVYSQLIRKYFKGTRPIVLGGIEASLRRISHYDFWTNSIRRSILFDAKADYLLYGMCEASVVQLAEALSEERDPRDIRGLCYISPTPVKAYVELPSHERVKSDTGAFTAMFKTFYGETDPITARGLCQLQDTRYVVLNPPPPAPSQERLDAVYALPFTHDLHPCDRKSGEVKALETIRSSITSHRGCYGECNFCAIGVHQGRTVSWRSEASILDEVSRLARRPDFNGIIQDVGGATANMWGFECPKKLEKGICRNRRCLFPEICPNMPVDHSHQIRLLQKIRRLRGVKKVFVRSGIRYDLINADKRHGALYLDALVSNHVSGQLKVAPEHSDPYILYLMGKQNIKHLLEFKNKFDALSRKAGKRQFLTYYFIAAHPGCRMQHMDSLKEFSSDHLKINPEQVQVFTPTPSTYSSLMYVTKKDPFSGAPLFVETGSRERERQKQTLTLKTAVNRSRHARKRGRA